MSIRIFDSTNEPLKPPAYNLDTYKKLVKRLSQIQSRFQPNCDVVRIRLRPQQTLEDVLASANQGHNPCEVTAQLRIVSPEARVITSSYPDRILDELHRELWRTGEGLPDDRTKEVRLTSTYSMDMLLAVLRAQPTASDPLRRHHAGGGLVTAIMGRHETDKRTRPEGARGGQRDEARFKDLTRRSGGVHKTQCKSARYAGEADNEWEGAPQDVSHTLRAHPTVQGRRVAGC